MLPAACEWPVTQRRGQMCLVNYHVLWLLNELNVLSFLYFQTQNDLESDGIICLTICYAHRTAAAKHFL